MVLASRAETYGMVIAEALARGLPVIAAEVGGVPEALGHGAGGQPARACSSRPMTRGPRRRAAGVAGRRGAARPPAPGRRRASRVAGAMAGHRVGRRRRPGGGGALTLEGVRVSAAWLALREPADAAARARDLAERLSARLRRPAPRSSTTSAPAPGRWAGGWRRCCPGPQHWILHDRDSDLLAVAGADRLGPAADGAAVTVETRRSDIRRLRAGELAGATSSPPPLCWTC